MLIFFDTETTDKVVLGVYPLCIQLAWSSDAGADVQTRLLRTRAKIAPGAQKIHGISQEKLEAEGEDPIHVYTDFLREVRGATHLVAHNATFDRNVLVRSLRHARVAPEDIRMFELKPVVCTMRILTPVTKLPHLTKRATRRTGKNTRKSYKWPRLCEAARFFGLDFDDTAAHNAGYDVQVLKAVYRCMLKHPDPGLKKMATGRQII